MSLIDVLGARGITCVVGAGGKKTTLYQVASQHDRAVVTSTVRIPIFDEHVERVAVTDDPMAAIERSDSWPLGIVPIRDGLDRYAGYDLEIIDELYTAPVDAILVKADGARMRLLKAPDETEPQIPSRVNTVIPVASVKSVGRRLHPATVHRIEHVVSLTDLAPGDRITTDAVASILTDPRGGLKSVPPSATVVPVLNMVDSDELARHGREIAQSILDRTDRIDRVVLSRMIAGEIIDVIT